MCIFRIASSPRLAETTQFDAERNPGLANKYAARLTGVPTVRAAKFYEVTKQIVMTSHLVDGIFISIANKTWNALTPAQKQKLQAAAQAASAYNNENRLKEEAQLVDFFKQQGLQITTPDVDVFRKTVQQAYLNSEYAKVWPKGVLDRINQTR